VRRFFPAFLLLFFLYLPAVPSSACSIYGDTETAYTICQMTEDTFGWNLTYVNVENCLILVGTEAETGRTIQNLASRQNGTSPDVGTWIRDLLTLVSCQEVGLYICCGNSMVVATRDFGAPEIRVMRANNLCNFSNSSYEDP
jgi:hypothetical protein